MIIHADVDAKCLSAQPQGLVLPNGNKLHGGAARAANLSVCTDNATLAAAFKDQSLRVMCDGCTAALATVPAV